MPLERALLPAVRKRLGGWGAGAASPMLKERQGVHHERVTDEIDMLAGVADAVGPPQPHRVIEASIGWWPTAAPRIRPPTGNELSVPGEDRLGAARGTKASGRAEGRGWLRRAGRGRASEGWPAHLPSQHVQLVAEYEVSTSLVRSERRASTTSSRTLRRAQ